MPNYKISGYVTESCDIRLMRGNSFLGHRESVPAGVYELIFSLDIIEDIDVIAVRSDGKIVGYGNIEPIETVDATNISIPDLGGITISNIDTVSALAFTSGTTQKTYNPSGFDRTKSIVIPLGQTNPNISNPAQSTITYYWGSDTNLTLYKIDTSSYTISLNFMLVQLENVNVYHDMLTWGGASQSYYDVTVPYIGSGTKLLISSGQSVSSMLYNARYYIYNNTTVRIYFSTVTSGCRYGFQYLTLL